MVRKVSEIKQWNEKMEGEPECGREKGGERERKGERWRERERKGET